MVKNAPPKWRPELRGRDKNIVKNKTIGLGISLILNNLMSYR
jgi:hypothetical protein